MQNFILSNAPSVWVCSFFFFFFKLNISFSSKEISESFFFFFPHEKYFECGDVSIIFAIWCQVFVLWKYHVLFDLKFLSRFLMTPPENVLKQFSDYVGLVRYNDSCTDVSSYTKWSFSWWLKVLLQLEKWRFYQRLCDL